MRIKNRKTASREDLLWEMDMKTAALKRIHRICNEQAGDRLEIKAKADKALADKPAPEISL
jgi:hypothetical protein